MNTSTLDTQIGCTYCVTAVTPCIVTAIVNETEITLLNLSAGQGSFIAPTRKVTLEGTGCMVRCFNAAALSAQGDGVIHVTQEQLTAGVPLQHNAWCILPATTEYCTVQPDTHTKQVSTMRLILPPLSRPEPLPHHWLRLPENDPGTLYWLFGELDIVPGYTYIIELTQLSAALTIANAVPLNAAL